MNRPQAFTAKPHRAAIKSAMNFRGITTKAQLARAAGVSRGTAGNLLNETRETFDPLTASKIASALGRQPEELFTLAPRA